MLWINLALYVEWPSVVTPPFNLSDLLDLNAIDGVEDPDAIETAFYRLAYHRLILPEGVRTSLQDRISFRLEYDLFGDG